MKMNYYADTDTLYIDLSSKTSADTKEVADGVLVDFDDQGNIVGIDIDHASQKLDLNELEIVELPLKIHKIRA